MAVPPFRKFQQKGAPISILHKYNAGRYRPVRVADEPLTIRCRCIKNASWAHNPTARNILGMNKIRLWCPFYTGREGDFIRLQVERGSHFRINSKSLKAETLLAHLQTKKAWMSLHMHAVCSWHPLFTTRVYNSVSMFARFNNPLC